MLIPLSLPVEAAQTLDLQTLDQVTASGVNPQHNWIQREGETVVAMGSTATVALESNTTLQGVVQSNAKALNIVNAAATDTAQLLNVAYIDDEIKHVEQSNSLEQDARFVGRLGRTLSGGPTVYYSYGRGYSNIISQGYTEGKIQNDTSLTTTLEREKFIASVGKWNPARDFSFSLGTWDTGSVSVDVPAINLILDTEVAGSYGLYASIGPVVTLYGPAIDFGSLQFAGDDLILHPGSFTLPGVDFGTATFKFCVVDCVSGSTHIGMVGGDKIEPFSDITFAGANPFKDFDLNAGSGIAFIGQGEVTVTGPGAYFDVKLTLDMNEILGPVTDLFSDIISNNPIKPISDLFSEGFDISIADELGVAMIFPEITLEERITLLDPIETEKYTVDENGIVVITGVPGQTKTYTVDENGLCVVFGASSCERKRVITLDSSHEEDGTVTTLQNRYGSNQMESWEHEETIVFVPANLEGAQADLIVTTDSHLTHSKNNNTSLSDGAQRNLTAMNAVNATNAVIGNASNMMAYRAQMTYSGTQLQSNQFVQNR